MFPLRRFSSGVWLLLATPCLWKARNSFTGTNIFLTARKSSTTNFFIGLILRPLLTSLRPAFLQAQTRVVLGGLHVVLSGCHMIALARPAGRQNG